MPLASLVTPNLAEAAALLDTRPARTLPDMRFQAMALRELGAPRVLIKGGHRNDGPEAVDLLLDVDGETLLRAPRVDTLNTHGTGCTLSSTPTAPAAPCPQPSRPCVPNATPGSRQQWTPRTGSPRR